MNTFLFTQITNTILGILIVGDLAFLINKKYKVTGGISVILAIFILLIGIITPISILICTIVAAIWGGIGVYSIHKDKKGKSVHNF